jgi:hypothetical protein
MFTGTAAKVVLLALLVSLLATPAIAKSPMEAFNAGIRASRAGNHAEALRHFERAQALGLDRAALDYNLGVTLYRLARYAEAGKYFERVTQHPPLAALGHYNLGLVAERLGDRERARNEYLIAQRLADDDRLRRLAALQLARLQPTEPEEPRGIMIVSAAGGYDDNLVVQQTGGAAKVGDQFLELFFAGSGTVSGTPRDGVRLDGSLYVVEYLSEDQFSMSFVRGGAARVKQWSSWRLEAGGQLELSTLGDLDYLRTLSLDLAAGRRLSAATTLKLGYQFSNVDARDALFSELGGYQQRVMAEGRRSDGDSWLRGVAFVELNDREDLREGGVFTSFSPRRAGVRAEYGRQFGADWEASASLGFVASRYRDADTLADGSQVRREDDQLRFGARVAKMLARQWQLSGEYSRYDNGSNLAAYDYRRNLYMLRMIGVF